jgi:hypothetical protein
LTGTGSRVEAEPQPGRSLRRANQWRSHKKSRPKAAFCPAVQQRKLLKRALKLY